MSNHDNEDSHRLRMRPTKGGLSGKTPRSRRRKEITVPQHLTGLRRCSGCKQYIVDWQAHYEAVSRPECKEAAALTLWGTTEPPKPKAKNKGGRPPGKTWSDAERKARLRSKRKGSTMLLEIGKEYGYMDDWVKLLELQGDPPVYAVVENRWGSRSTIQVAELYEKE